MHKLFYIFLFFSGSLIQAQQEDNPFRAAESKDEIPSHDTGVDQPQAGPANPGGDDDLPIDDYLPLLVITAVGIIVYTTQKKRNLIRK